MTDGLTTPPPSQAFNIRKHFCMLSIFWFGKQKTKFCFQKHAKCFSNVCQLLAVDKHFKNNRGNIGETNGKHKKNLGNSVFTYMFVNVDKALKIMFLWRLKRVTLTLLPQFCTCSLAKASLFSSSSSVVTRVPGSSCDWLRYLGLYCPES